MELNVFKSASQYLPVYCDDGSDVCRDRMLMKVLLTEHCYRYLRPFFDAETGVPKPSGRTGPDLTEAWHYRGARVSALAEDCDMTVPLRLLAARAYVEGIEASIAFTFAVSS